MKKKLLSALALILVMCMCASCYLVETPIAEEYSVIFASQGNGSVSAVSNGVELSSGSKLEANAKVVFMATPDEGYRFKCFAVGETESTANPLTVTVTSDTSVTATFEKIETYVVSYASEDAGMGTVSGTVAKDATVQKGTSVTLTASANVGYYFVGWFSGETSVSTEASYTFTVNQTVNFTAKFAENVTPPVTTYKVTYAADNATGGTVQGTVTSGTSVAGGTSITLTAVPAAGYSFAGWYSGTVLVSASASYTFGVSANVTVPLSSKNQPAKV